MIDRAGLEQIAEQQGITVEQLGADVYALAEWLDRKGNRGVTQREISEANPPGVHLYVVALPDVREGIIFHAEENRRRREYVGFGVRKRPDWRLTWGDRFGWESEIGQRIILDMWGEAEVEHDKRRTRRRHETYPGGRYEDTSSVQIAYYAACMDVMWRRWRERSRATLVNPAGMLAQFMAMACAEMRSMFVGELVYRKKSQPEVKPSRKKWDKAVADFAKAADLLEAGTGHFFTAEFVEQAIQSAEEPDLRVDFEHLPKLPEADTPVRWKRDSEVVREFMRFLAESEEGSFEREDAELILDNLRKMLARAKGERVS